jgi:hypothetical protein
LKLILGYEKERRSVPDALPVKLPFFPTILCYNIEYENKKQK